ncbi:tRNA modification GTPase trmE [Spirosomataceae bacterium TFI 002]|nr:tRNA modification GTPase trmE [Spirosomataceae bacterium TFI 002]
MENKIIENEPICALATAQGVGAIAVIRVSGEKCIELVDRIFKGKKLTNVASHTVHFGLIMEGEKLVDEVLATVFKNPKSFTKEDSVEISCHGSSYIIGSILKLLVANGCKIAKPGEFTQRAFANGQFDLIQAEAVADLIAADSAAAHKAAMHQMRGGFSKKLAELREDLIHFASMIELELDFGEEDVEFADRDDLRKLIYDINKQLLPLISSFDEGNVIKEGVPVAIIGTPNAGKSTLLNAFLNEDKAIVSDIAGTTRDTIEDILIVGGRKFRFIDTAGIRKTEDTVENIGIDRSRKAIDKSEIVIVLYENEKDKSYLLENFEAAFNNKKLLFVRNKIDVDNYQAQEGEIGISAKEGTNVEHLLEKLTSLYSLEQSGDIVVTNLRHYEHLIKTNEALEEVLTGLDNGVTGDFLAQDIRLSLHHLGEITGTITTDDLLKNIFGKFCIGK